MKKEYINPKTEQSIQYMIIQCLCESNKTWGDEDGNGGSVGDDNGGDISFSKERNDEMEYGNIW